MKVKIFCDWDDKKLQEKINDFLSLQLKGKIKIIKQSYAGENYTSISIWYEED